MVPMFLTPRVQKLPNRMNGPVPSNSIANQDPLSIDLKAREVGVGVSGDRRLDDTLGHGDVEWVRLAKEGTGRQVEGVVGWGERDGRTGGGLELAGGLRSGVERCGPAGEGVLWRFDDDFFVGGDIVGIIFCTRTLASLRATE